MFREGIRCAMSVISLELLAQIEAQRLDGTLHNNTQYRELLKQAVKDMISLSAERIRQGEANIKGHMFLNMILAQVEAIGAGTSCEFKMAQSARDSLEFCHDLLRTRSSPSHAGLTSAGLYGGQEGYGLDLEFEFFLPHAEFS
jgi:hypothetical protein